MTTHVWYRLAFDAVVVAAGTHHYVSADTALHHRGARMLADHLLRAGRAARADAAHDQDVQQRGEEMISFVRVVWYLKLKYTTRACL